MIASGEPLLFTRRLTPDLEYANASTPEYQFLNRSPRAAVESIRLLLEDWFSRVPESEAPRLAAAFRSSDNREHWSALNEIYCHELLLRNGFSVAMHQPGAGGRRKDFLAVRGPISIEVEATISSDSTDAHSELALFGRLTDYFDTQALVPGFRYSLEVEKRTDNLPPLKQLAHEISSWASGFDRAEARRMIEASNGATAPSKTFSGGGWELRIGLLPRPADEDANDRDRRSVGIGPVYGGELHHDSALRNSLKGKAGHYHDHRLPFVVAVAVVFDFRMDDDIDVLQALLGTEQVIYDMRTMSHRPGRARDGIWIGPKGPRNRDLSAALIVNQLHSWYIPKTGLDLYLNPWARHQLPENTLDVHTVRWDIATGTRIDLPGPEPWRIFGISPDWPEDSDDRDERTST